MSRSFRGHAKDQQILKIRGDQNLYGFGQGFFHAKQIIVKINMGFDPESLSRT